METLIHYWSHYCTLDDGHLQWPKDNVRHLPQLNRQQKLFAPGDMPNHCYFVTHGLLAGIRWDADGRHVGYENYPHFLAVFKKFFKETPRNFRQKP